MSKQFMFLQVFFCKKFDLYFIHNCKLILNVTCELLRQKKCRITFVSSHLPGYAIVCTSCKPVISLSNSHRHRFRKIIIGIIDIVIALCRLGKG
jgi:hypothetical protein